VRVFHTNRSSEHPFSIFDPRTSALQIDEVVEVWCHNGPGVRQAVVRDVSESCATLELLAT
jgi:hypothetical protein